MTKLQALTALRDKVKAGADLTYRDFSVLNFDGTVHGEVIGLGSYGGSLDAAKALDQAVPTPNLVVSDEDAKIILFGKDGARHWLLLKIEALIAQEGQA